MKTVWFTRSLAEALLLVAAGGPSARLEDRPPSRQYPAEGHLFVVKRRAWMDPKKIKEALNA